MWKTSMIPSILATLIITRLTKAGEYYLIQFRKLRLLCMYIHIYVKERQKFTFYIHILRKSVFSQVNNFLYILLHFSIKFMTTK